MTESEKPSAPPSGAASGPPKPPMPRPLDIPIVKHLRSKRVILASASPRRRALLSQVRHPSSPAPSFRPQKHRPSSWLEQS